MPREKRTSKPKEAKTYNHDKEHPLRPDIGTEAQFKKKKPPETYRYDSSLSPELDWDDNPSREQAEAQIKAISSHLEQLSAHLSQLDTVAESLQSDAEALKILYSVRDNITQQIREVTTSLNKLKALSQPFLNWTGKAERLSFDVPTLPLFVHERLSTRAIIETLKSHKSGGEQLSLFDLFNDPKWSITDQILRAYEYHGDWVNRMILGDSLVTMNSLLQYEGLGGQVQMIYIDPPYGVKFGSNFQPFVRKRDVKHNDDDNFTREPEMVQAYRDTWELGLHSYLTYLRDRLLLARDLLTDSGSVFVQISDENVHHVRELMDEVFGGENFVSLISYTTSGGFDSSTLSRAGDYLIWYAKNKPFIKYIELFKEKSSPVGDTNSKYDQIELSDGVRRGLTIQEKSGLDLLPINSRIFRLDNIISQGSGDNTKRKYDFEGTIFDCGSNHHWKASVPDGMDQLSKARRIAMTSNGKLAYVRYYNDFPVTRITNIWNDIGGTVQSRSDPKVYVVQTGTSVTQRCLLMTTDPGDLVLDITCGSGTTAYVAEQWGRRWITCDVSRVPLALARQRLLTATFPWYELKDNNSPAGGFVYKRKQNKKGEEVGGIVPHITLKSIANNEPPDEEILVDKPETDNSIVRVCSPFTIEGTIPPPVDMEAEDSPDAEDRGTKPETEAIEADSTASFTDRMLEILQKVPVLRLPNNKTLTFSHIRKPAKTQSLSAEAMTVNSDQLTVTSDESKLEPVAFLFGPENGAIAERTVFEAAKEADSKHYSHLYIIGFAIAPNARQMVENCQESMNISATYIQATPDLLMGDLLKNMRSSQIFSVCGLPEIKLHKTDDNKYQVELLGLDVFDPITMEVDHEVAKNVPAWFLDTNYNGLCFHVNQAFFPRTSAWDSLKKALKGTYEESVWEHLSGTISSSFEAGEHQQIAVKVIDDRGNELLVVKDLKES
ncbi:DNA methyltransferase [Crocosphaera sp. XPORK-15E]|uniref:DNA methyltransferase n=1 Tax=Crocosphaera sp. XPORK-15E TaxID=3110247 RepID=UPI002B217CAB|nr:DNA methyltransferase [Crocosphaera sp. XPORK-15E]MEA5536842.1 DNA methyltransferase [Crocosphaera sp. XPORK-15E]